MPGSLREWLLLLGSVAVTLLVAVGLIRAFSPTLLGIAVDRQVVQLSEARPPYFDGVFQAADMTAADGIIRDPMLGQRHKILEPENSRPNAPFDLLGFRNRAVPVVADIVTLGDSLAVGPNTLIDFNWPRQLVARIQDMRAADGRATGDGSGGRPSVYNISMGGWGAVQYLYMFDKALFFRPRVVVVAYAMGNDSLEALHLAYDFEPWKFLRSAATMPTRPPSAWPPDPAAAWDVRFADGVRTIFTPASRLSANDRDYPGIAEGYRIMAETGRRMADRGADRGVNVVFTIIPTKEWVYGDKVRAEALDAPDDYRRLLAHEGRNIAELAEALGDLGPHTAYVDVAAVLRQVALGAEPLYLESHDGHPVAYGYDVIATTLARAVLPMLPPPLADGVVGLDEQGQTHGFGKVVLVRDGAAHWFQGPYMFTANGWSDTTMRVVTRRDLAGLADRGVIAVVDPARYGPRTAPFTARSTTAVAP